MSSAGAPWSRGQSSERATPRVVVRASPRGKSFVEALSAESRFRLGRVALGLICRAREKVGRVWGRDPVERWWDL